MWSVSYVTCVDIAGTDRPDICLLTARSTKNSVAFALSVLNENVSLKQKRLRANNAGFITKDVGKAIMKRFQLINHFLKHKIESSKITYNK